MKNFTVRAHVLAVIILFSVSTYSWGPGHSAPMPICTVAKEYAALVGESSTSDVIVAQNFCKKYLAIEYNRLTHDTIFHSDTYMVSVNETVDALVRMEGHIPQKRRMYAESFRVSDESVMDVIASVISGSFIEKDVDYYVDIYSGGEFPQDIPHELVAAGWYLASTSDFWFSEIINEDKILADLYKTFKAKNEALYPYRSNKLLTDKNHKLHYKGVHAMLSSLSTFMNRLRYFGVDLNKKEYMAVYSSAHHYFLDGIKGGLSVCGLG